MTIARSRYVFSFSVLCIVICAPAFASQGQVIHSLVGQASPEQAVYAYSRQQVAQEDALSAGVYMELADGSRCTTGFPVVEDASQTLAYTTAGHCALGQQEFPLLVDHSGSYVGHLLAYRWGFEEFLGFGATWSEDTDTALVVNYLGDDKLRPEPSLYVGAVDSAERLHIHDYRDPLLGERVCFSGAATGENCKGVVTRVNVSTVVYDADGIGMPIDGLVEVRSWDGSVLAQPGDSGGPVYIKESIGLNDVATGIGVIEGGASAKPSSTAYIIPASKIVPEGWSLLKAQCSWSWFMYRCE